MDQSIGVLEAVAENTEMGKNTLSQLLKMTNDAALCGELRREEAEYHRLNQCAHVAMAERGGSVRGQTKWAKTMTHMGICMETFKDKSTRKIAEMLIEGGNQGIIDCEKTRADYPQADAESKALLQQVEDFQQDTIRRLKEYLG